MESVESADAIKLFIDRAKTARPSFELTSTNVEAVAEVCRKLDGIPLAIELAAARVKILSIDQILTKLDDRFKLLVGRSMLPRHQTLQAVIEWSYDQLSNEEQRLLRSLSVFAGGWTLALASKVIGNLDEFEVMELHSQLVDKSIVVVASDESAAQRYSFLETVRQFLFDKLTEGGESEDVKAAHFNAMLDLAEQAYGERATNEERWTTELEVESDNMVHRGCARRSYQNARVDGSGAPHFSPTGTLGKAGREHRSHRWSRKTFTECRFFMVGRRGQEIRR